MTDEESLDSNFIPNVEDNAKSNDEKIDNQHSKPKKGSKKTNDEHTNLKRKIDNQHSKPKKRSKKTNDDRNGDSELNIEDTNVDSETNVQDEEDKKEWSVKSIGKYTKMGNKLEFEVYWVGYSQPTIEPVENLLDNEHFHLKMKEQRKIIEKNGKSGNPRGNIDSYFVEKLKKDGENKFGQFLREKIEEIYNIGTEIEKIALCKLFKTKVKNEIDLFDNLSDLNDFYM